MRYLIYFFTTLLLVSCEYLESGKDASSKNRNIVRQYYANGGLKNEIEIKDGKRHGLAKRYYKNGKVHQMITYTNNVKDGLATTFYENGQKYMETPYENGFIHGIRKKFRSNGMLMAEIPFHQGSIMAGLKEYLLDGSEKQNYPEIQIKEDNQILLNNRYFLKLSVTNATNKVKYYIGKLDENKTIPGNAVQLPRTTPGKSEVMYSVPPGTFTMEELNIIAVATTKLGNEYITEKSFNVAVENRGL